MDFYDEIQDEIRRKNVAIEKSFDPFYMDRDELNQFEKGKKAGVGEIRTHGGKKVQKQGDGSWKPVKDGGGKSSGGESKESELDKLRDQYDRAYERKDMDAVEALEIKIDQLEDELSNSKKKPESSNVKKKEVSKKEKFMQEHIYPEVDSMMRSSGLSRKDAISALLEQKPYKG